MLSAISVVSELLVRMTLGKALARDRGGRVLLRNNLVQVNLTRVPLSPSSIIWYRPTDSDALWQRR